LRTEGTLCSQSWDGPAADLNQNPIQGWREAVRGFLNLEQARLGNR